VIERTVGPRPAPTVGAFGKSVKRDCFPEIERVGRTLGLPCLRFRGPTNGDIVKGRKGMLVLGKSQKTDL